MITEIARQIDVIDILAKLFCKRQRCATESIIKSSFSAGFSAVSHGVLCFCQGEMQCQRVSA